MIELLRRTAAADPSAAAVIGDSGATTYGELVAASVAIGRALAARGVGKGARVGLLAPNWPEWIPLALAVWRCGGVLVPLNTLARPRELAHLLRHADVTLLVALRRFLRHDNRQSDQRFPEWVLKCPWMGLLKSAVLAFASRNSRMV